MPGPKPPPSPRGRARSFSSIEAYLSLGSNLGDRLKNLEEAVRFLKRHLSGLEISSIYETEPLYLAEQPRFLNCVVRGDTGLEPEALLDRIQAIEAKIGRDRTRAVPKGPRPIDIDILLFGNHAIRTPRLLIPHPGMEERAFVLVPLVELEPGLKDPSGRRSYRDMLLALGSEGVYTFAPRRYTEGLFEHD